MPCAIFCGLIPCTLTQQRKLNNAMSSFEFVKSPEEFLQPKPPRIGCTPLLEAEADELAACLTDPEVLRTLTCSTAPIDAETIRTQWMTSETARFYALRDASSSEMLGFLQVTRPATEITLARILPFMPLGDTVELGLGLRRSAWGQGLGTEAVAWFLEDLRAAERPLLCLAGALKSNTRSIRIMQKLGAHVLGEDDSNVTCGLWIHRKDSRPASAEQTERGNRLSQMKVSKRSSIRGR